MCDNIKNEKSDNSDQIFMNLLTQGVYSILYKRISSVRIRDIRILAAFNHFIKNVDCGKSFSLAEILRITDCLLFSGKINENVGNKIFMYDPKNVKDNKVSDKLLKNSIGNIFFLLSLNNGIIFSTEVFSEKLEILETNRYLIVPPKKVEKFTKLCGENGIELSCIGEFSSENKIVFNQNGETHTFDKNILSKNDEDNHLELTEKNFDSFMSGYNAVASLLLMDTVSENNILRLGIDGDFSSVLARFLGFYVGISDFKPKTFRMIFTTEAKFGVSVAKPLVSDGDYLYLLRLHNNQFEMTDKVHLNQLLNYLKEKNKIGAIKYAIPYAKGIETTLQKIVPDGIEYVSFEYQENDKFALVACVGRGESLNGVKIGYYKNVE